MTRKASAASALAAALLTLAAAPATAVPINGGTLAANQCSFGGPSPNHGISTSIDCEGAWRESEGDTMIVTGDDAGNEAKVNSNSGFAGFTDWDLVAELSPTSGSVVSDTFTGYGVVGTGNFSFNMPGSLDGEGGFWAIDTIGDATEAAISILAERLDGSSVWAIYQLDTSVLSGSASTTLASELGAGAKTTITSLQLYLRQSVADVPVPAAAPMLLTALGGLALLRRRRAAAKA